MLNVPTVEHERAERAEEDAQQNQSHELQRRRLRRRPLSGDRVQGWADVRKLEQDDGTGVEKYQVNLNTTAQLSWAEWQLMCDAEPTEAQDATWCIIPGHEDEDEYEEEDDDDAHEEDANAMDTTDSTARQSDTHRVQDDGQQTRNQRTASASTRFVRRQSASPHGESAGDSPRES